MAEVIPSNASFDPVTINLLSDAFEQARSQGSNIRQSVGSTSLCQHGARSDGQTYRQFGRARRARREQTQQKRIPIFHRELQGLCRLSWRPHGPPGLSEDPAAHDCGLVASSREAACSRLCSWCRYARGCSQHCLDLNHWRSLPEVSRFAQTSSP
jgi:hypothetical protein